MKLRYHHVVVKCRCANMPIHFWRDLLSKLKVVYAAFGLKRDAPYSHTCYIFYEDDAYLRTYARFLEPIKQQVDEWIEEHDVSRGNLLYIRHKYHMRCPTNYQIDNIDDYI